MHLSVFHCYNPGQNSFEHLRTNDGNHTSSQNCHRKMLSPKRTNVGLKSEMQTWLGTNYHQH